MPVHAFVDESKVRGFTLVATVVSPPDLSECRRRLRDLLLPNQRRLHFTKERPSRQREIAVAVANLPAQAWIYEAEQQVHETSARRAALGRLVQDLSKVLAQGLVIEQDDSLIRSDRETLYTAVRLHDTEDRLRYRHVRPHQEPVLWASDAIAWCWTKGSAWRGLVSPVVSLHRTL